MVDIGLNLILANPIPSMVELSKAAEANGINNLWFSELPGFRSPFETMTAVALNTKKIGIGPGCTSPFLRHPITTAFALATLNELAPGRISAAICHGDVISLRYLDRTPDKPLTGIRDAVNIWRDYFSGQTVNYQGKVFSTNNIRLQFPRPHKIPILLAGSGLGVSSLSGELADGMFFDMIPLKALPIALKKIQEGANKANKRLTDFIYGSAYSFAVSENEKQAIKIAKPSAVWGLTVAPTYYRESVGVSEDEIREIRKYLPDRVKAAQHTPDWMAAPFIIAGTAKTCVSRIHEITKAGITQINLVPPPNLSMDLINTLGQEIIPNL